jgi:ABC-type antimicrobial peptide transport system permease subunit
MEKVRAQSVASERFLMVLLLLFAGVALVLAVIGIHGVTAQFMRQRTQEIGVRLALGAEPTAVLRMMVGQGAVLVGGGIALGVAIALITTRAMTGLLFQVKPVDPVTFVGVATTLALAGLVATWLPSRRASRQDPLSALRPD